MNTFSLSNPLSLCGFLWLIWALYWSISSKFVQKTKFTESFILRLQHLFQILFGMMLIFHDTSFQFFSLGHFSDNTKLNLVGVLVTFFGLAYAVWARVFLGRNWSGTITLKEDHKLIRGGPYKLTRHPIYTGFIIGTFGSALASGKIEALLGVILIFVAYLIKIRREEAVLVKEFGQEYINFRKDVKALLPFIF